MIQKEWVWAHPDWPQFQYELARIQEREQRFLMCAGELSGVIRYLSEDEKQTMTLELVGLEAFKTSEIEGELLDRESLQSSIRKCFGLQAAHGKSQPRELGIAEMMRHLYSTFDEPLTHETLFQWHTFLMSGHSYIKEVGCYRQQPEPMQIVSGYLNKPKVHYEAPPSVQMQQEMDRFIAWFNQSAPNGEQPLPALTRAAIAHVYFLMIHPFEDGNGRIGRALVEKILAQQCRQPTLTAISYVIQENKKAYYDAIARQNTTLSLDAWLDYFSLLMLEAQACTLKHMEFTLQKAQFLEKYSKLLNDRQERVVRRVLQEGLGGFAQGLTVKKYIRLTDASRATATRDLQHLVEQGAIIRTGDTKSTRYWINLPELNSFKRLSALYPNPLDEEEASSS
jgi:Fic family protein